MDTSGFYKLDVTTNSLLFAPNFVHMPEQSLSRDDVAVKTGSHNGWQWFDSDSAAYNFHGLVNGNNPLTVTRLQAVLALNSINKLDAVNAAIASGTIEQQLAWSSATEFHRNSAMLNQILTAIGMSAADIDSLFAAAKAISV